MGVIRSCNTVAAKRALFSGGILAGHNYKIALIKAGFKGTYDRTLVSYDQIGDDEVSAPGYPKGGISLKDVRIIEEDDRTLLISALAEFPNVTVRSEGAVIYNATSASLAIACLSFGGAVSSTNDSFTVANATGQVVIFTLKG